MFTVVKAEQLTQLGWFGLDDRYYVKAIVGNETQNTKELNNHSPQWNQSFSFTPGGDKATLTLEVYGVDTRSHERLGSVCHTLDVDDGAQSYREALGANDTRHKTTSFLEYKVVPRAGNAHEMASDVITSLSKSGVAAVVEQLDDIPITPLIGYLERFADSMSVFSEIHPYAKAAWKIVSAAYKLYQRQMEKDRKICSLYREMNSTYKVIFDGGRLESSRIPDIAKDQREVVLRVSQQTNECAYFIRDYCTRDLKDKMKALISDRVTEAQITGYIEKFNQLKQAFTDEVSIVTQIAVARVLTEVQDISVQLDLDKLTLVDGATLGESEKLCFPGTRTELLDQIYSWIDMSDGTSSGVETQRVLFLTGEAGAGKSALAHTIAHHFGPLQRLGASFSFNLDRDYEKSVHKLFPHIARQLTELHESMKKAVAAEVHDHPALLSMRDIEQQFQKLVVRPLKKWRSPGPVVIVINGINRGGDRAIQGEEVPLCERLASILARAADEFPPEVRFIVTARPDPALLSIFSESGSAHHIDIMSVPLEITYRDMCEFVRIRLQMKRAWLKQHGHEQPLIDIDEQSCRILAAASRGNFGWVSSALFKIASMDSPSASPGGRQPKDEYENFVLNILKESWPASSRRSIL
ncbi:hypothetical protein EIP86_009780 [Pleurotus ostreatoroseus]|nr:hypothetical protein EIP86_009780 [Pleurotus ostreatoroseus]